MSWLTNLKLKYKLLLLLLFPILTLVLLGSKLIIENVRQYNALIQTDERSHVLMALDQVMDSLQIEEISSIGSRKQDQAKALVDIRKNVDHNIEAFIKTTQAFADALQNDHLQDEVNSLVSDLKQLPQIRFQIDNNSISEKDVENFFEKMIGKGLDVVGLIGLESPPSVSKLISSYLALTGVQQALRQEDYTVDEVIAEGKFTLTTYSNFIGSIVSQRNHQNSFYRRASPEYKKKYDLAMQQQLLNEFSNVENEANKDPFNKGVDITRQTWDKLVDAKAAALLGLKTGLLQDVMNEVDRLLDEAKSALLYYSLLLFFALLTSLFLAYIIVKSISLPLNSAVSIADAVSKGDLTTTPTLSGRKDEIGALEESWHRMIEHLKKLTTRIQEESNILNNSARGIMQSIVEASSGTEETAVAVAETTTTVEELKQTADLATAKARDVVSTTSNVVKVLDESEKSIHATIDGMTILQERMSKISESIQKLSEQSQEISEINNTVKDFAEQSNLLAINAGIEAAKAGEQGKGFAVVADEIRNLAEQSKQATKKVHTILKDIQNAISAVVMTTEQGVKAVDQGITQSTHTNESLRSLTLSINEAELSANQIEASSRQQLIGVQQVTIAMSNIKEASANHVNIMQEIKKELEGLNSVGEKLEELVHSFRL